MARPTIDQKEKRHIRFTFRLNDREEKWLDYLTSYSNKSRDSQTIYQANRRTRARFGATKQAIPAIRFPKTGVPFSKEWYYFTKARRINNLPEIPFGIIGSGQGRNLRIDERAEGFENITKETSGHLDTELSFHRNASSSILGGIAGLLDGVVESEKNEHKLERKRNKGMLR